MKETVLIIGGCRSGKSSHALALAEQTSAERKIFIATCVPRDVEMKQRVANHQRERDLSWKILETPVGVADAIRVHSLQSDVILVDCLTLWVSNLLMQEKNMDDIREYLQELLESLQSAPCPVFLVSNEVGAGIVPQNKLSRLFRDAVGMVNQNIAENADRVIWMVAGIPVPVK